MDISCRQTSPKSSHNLTIRTILTHTMSILPVRFTTLLKLSLVYYVVYLTFFVCRNDYSDSNDIVQYTCGHINNSVYPIWTSQIQPHLDKLDKDYGISASVKPVVAEIHSKIAALDEKFEISYKSEKAWASTKIWATEVFGDISIRAILIAKFQYARLMLYWEGNVAPITKYYVAQYQKTWGTSINRFANKARLNAHVYWKSSKRHTLRFFSLKVAPFYHQIVNTVSSNKHVVRMWDAIHPEAAVAEIQRVYAILLKKSVEYSTKLQRKKDFILAEIKNFHKIDTLKKRWKRDTAKTLSLVKEILEDVISYNKPVVDDETPVDLDVETETEIEESVPEEEVVDVVEESESESVESGTQSESEVDDSDSEETEVVTFTATQTRTVTVVKSGPPPSPETTAAEESAGDVVSVELNEDVTKYGDDSSKAQIDFELNYWKSKVDKTLDLAYNSLESEMKDALNATIESLKEKISSNFTELLQGNYARYKVMNELISRIDKDSQYIRESGKIIEEPEVDRQIMRDRIKEAYEAVEGSMKDVEVNLNQFHLEIMEKYFAVVQDTVDVLESFADTTILDFSNRLSGLLEILETNSDFEDELSWSAWKQFHKVKDLIFSIRDKIYNEAEEYKYNPRGKTKPNGLRTWDQYLDNINFHIKFLLTDNDEYLKLVRAKANIAYQLREGLTRELVAKAEADALAEAEALAEAQAKAEAEEKARADAIAEEEYMKSVNAKVNEANEAYQLLKESESSVVLESVTSETTELEQPEAAEIESSEPASVVTEIISQGSPENIKVTILEENLEDPESPADAFPEQVQEEVDLSGLPVDDTIAAEPQSFDDDNIVEELEVVEDAPELLEATD